MSANFEAKKVVVQEITDKIKSSKSVVLVDYKNLTVKEVSELRNKCKQAGCEYKVYKNTLVRKALNDLGFNQFDNDLNGPTAVAFGSDETAAPKVMVAAAKDYDQKILLKSAFVDNGYVDKSGIKALAAIPAREELVAKMLGSLNSPATNLAGVLNNVVSALVSVLNAVATKEQA